VTVNPLVVPRINQPTDIWAGVWIAEDIELIVQGVQTGSWVDTSIGSISAALDGLAFVADPFSGLLQYFAASLMEHFGPLREALDWLAGDPGQIAGHAQTWRNVSASLTTQHTDLTAALNTDIPTWASAAATAYRGWAQLQHSAVDGLSKAADAMAIITEYAGLVVATVRVLVRDLIAIAFSRAVTYITEEVFSLGFATPVVAAQLSTLVLSCAARVTRLMHGMVNSLASLFEMAGRLARHVDELKKILGRLGNATPSGGKINLSVDGFTPPSKGSPESPGMSGEAPEVRDPNLPDFSNPNVDPKKISDYVMNPDHPVGGNKYRVINAATGLGPGDALTIEQQIREGVRHATPILGKADQYGQRWAVDVVLTGPKGSIVVRTAWILDAGTSTPRLVTVSFP
jgi:Domain of unknown function (DUF6883)